MRCCRTRRWRATSGFQAVRGDLLARLDRPADARDAFLAAAGLAGNAREKALMAERAAAQAQRLTPASGRSV